MLSYSAMMRVSLADGENNSKNFQTQSLSHHRTHSRYIWRRKMPSLQLKSSWLSKYWRLGKLQIAKKCDLKCQAFELSSLAYSCGVMWPGVLWARRKIGKFGWSSPCTKRQTGRMQSLPKHLFLGLPEKVNAKCLEKRCHEIVEPKLNDARRGLRPCLST